MITKEGGFKLPSFIENEVVMDEGQDSSYLGVLRKKTKDLPGFPKGSIIPGSDTYKYRLGDNFCIAKPLFEEDNISVSTWELKAETTFPAHRHDEKEWFIVYRGKLEVSVEGRGTHTLSGGDSFYVPSGVAHSLYFFEDTNCLAVTVPQSDDYPREVSRDG